MLDSQLAAQIDAARAYEKLLVPALFGPWALVVAKRTHAAAGDHVLDVACGTGVLARHLASNVGVDGSVAGLDPNVGMLGIAAELAPAVEWRQGVAESLPYPDGTFDAVASQFGLMFFTDHQQALREMKRVVKPGGRVTVAVWDSLDSNPAYATEVDLLDRMAGRMAGAALRAPFALGDAARLTDLFTSSGLLSVDIVPCSCTAEFPSIRVMVEADLRGWLPVMGVELTEEQIAVILDAAETALRSFRTAHGTLSFETHALVGTGTAPS